MKLTKYFIAIAAVVSTLTACTSDLDGIKYNPDNVKAGGLTADQTDIAVTAGNKKQTLLNLTWEKSDFGISVAPTYTVEIDKAGGDFSNPKILASGSDLTKSFTGTELNQAALDIQIKDDPEAEYSYDPQPIDFRIKSYFSEDIDAIYSNTVTVTITPYAGKVDYAILNVPGALGNWDAAETTQVLYVTNTKKPNIFEGYIYFDESNLSFKLAKGSWDADKNWGGADGVLVPGGNNISVPAAGCYYIHADLDALTYTLSKSDWSIFGDAVGGTDVDMTYDKENNVYRATYTFSGTGTFKFRANHANDVTYGHDPNGEDYDLKIGGDELTPLPGEYTVALSFVTGYPSYAFYPGGKISKYTYLSLPGSMNNWKADTQDNVIIKDKKYEEYIYLTADDNFKIADGSWDADKNWGSDDNKNLVANGANIHVAEEGIYNLTADIDALTMSLTKQEWSIVGDAAAGWDNDTYLTWNATTKQLELEANLNAGTCKFRANGGWTYNFGGAGIGENVSAIVDGDNITITDAGKYKIILNLVTSLNHPAPTYSIVKE